MKRNLCITGFVNTNYLKPLQNSLVDTKIWYGSLAVEPILNVLAVYRVYRVPKCTYSPGTLINPLNKLLLKDYQFMFMILNQLSVTASDLCF